MVSTPRKRKLSPYGKDDYGLSPVKRPLMDIENRGANLHHAKSKFMRRLDYSFATEENRENSDSDDALQLNTGSFYCKKSQYLNPLERKMLGLSKISVNKVNDLHASRKANCISQKFKLNNKKKLKLLMNNQHKKGKKKFQNNLNIKTFSTDLENFPKNKIKDWQKNTSSKPQNGLSVRDHAQASEKQVLDGTSRKFFSSRNESPWRKAFTSSEDWKKALRLKFKSGVAAVLNKVTMPSPNQDTKSPLPILQNKVSIKDKHSTSEIYAQNHTEKEYTHHTDRALLRSENVIQTDCSDFSPTHSADKENSVSIDSVKSPVIIKILSSPNVMSNTEENCNRCIKGEEKNISSEQVFQEKKEKKSSYPIFNMASTKADSVNRMAKKQQQGSLCTAKDLNLNSPLRLMLKYSKNDRMEQLIIDAGQKEIGARQCSVCNMVYTRGDPQDEKTHSNYHEMFQSSLRFPGWKKEHVLGDFHDGRVIMVTKNDQNFKLKKITDIMHIVDRDLGFPDLGLPCRMNTTFILFISNEKKVAGCLVAESITQACRVVLDTSSKLSVPCLPYSEKTPAKNKVCSEGLWCSSSEPVKAVCGISRIWTSFDYRRCKVATRMVDCLRCNFIYGYALSMDEIAFSDPSLDGRAFAASYTGTPSFLVYK